MNTHVPEPTVDAEKWTIGQMAAEFNVSLRTLRFYEDRKLLRPTREGNTRIYSQNDFDRMRLILNGKELGLTLTEIFNLLQEADAKQSPDLEAQMTPAQVRIQIEYHERIMTESGAALERLRAMEAQFPGASTT